MFRLLTFEKFIPKNIEGRAELLKNITNKKKLEFQKFTENFKLNLYKLKNNHSNDLKEEKILNIFRKIEYVECYDFYIFTREKYNKWLFQYDLESNEIILRDFEEIFEDFDTNKDLTDFISNIFLKYFRFKPNVLLDI